MDMATAANAPVLAVPKYGEGVQIWNTASLRQISSFATTLDFGGRRLALSSTGELLFTGSYTSQTISCHNTSDGQILWRNTGLGKVQDISYNAKSNSVTCGFVGSECMVISVEDGAVMEHLRGIDWSIEHPLNGTRLMVADSLRLMSNDGKVSEIRRETIAVLSAAFGNRTVCFSEAAGHVRSVDIDSGREIWRYEPTPGRHVLQLAYFPNDERFYGIEWYHIGGSGDQSLLGIHASSGRAEEIAHFDVPLWRVLSPFDGLLYDSKGQAFDVKTGKLVRQLPFSKAPEL